MEKIFGEQIREIESMSKIPEDIRKLAERIHAAKEKKKRKEMSEKGNERGNSGAIIAFQISTDLISLI